MIDLLKNHCLKKQHVSEGFPLDDHTLAFKLHGKIFVLFSLKDDPLRMNVKCSPEYAIELRETYWQVKPGYHSNKKHWNTIVIESIDTDLILKWIVHSYQLVWNKLPNRLKG